MIFKYSFLTTSIYLTNWSSTFSILGQFFSLISLFILILFLTYYTTKLLANSKIKSMTKDNINVIETVCIGTNYIHIIKVGEQFFLVGSSKEGIRLISEIDEKNIKLNIKLKEQTEKNITKEKFKEYFNGHLGKLKGKGEK